jgi:hypothetical protein
MNYTRCISPRAGGMPGERCRRRAIYFGRWAGGGVCFEHVDDPNQLHAEDYDRYFVESEKRGPKKE